LPDSTVDIEQGNRLAPIPDDILGAEVERQIERARKLAGRSFQEAAPRADTGG
jgi:hypothetical protein